MLHTASQDSATGDQGSLHALSMVYVLCDANGTLEPPEAPLKDLILCAVLCPFLALCPIHLHAIEYCCPRLIAVKRHRERILRGPELRTYCCCQGTYLGVKVLRWPTLEERLGFLEAYYPQIPPASLEEGSTQTQPAEI